MSKSKTVIKKYNITSDYSSEEGGIDYYETSTSNKRSNQSSSATNAQNFKNQFREECGDTNEISALKLYKESGEYWK